MGDCGWTSATSYFQRTTDIIRRRSKRRWVCSVYLCCGIQITYKNRAHTSGFQIVTVNISRQNRQNVTAAEPITGCIVERQRNTNSRSSMMSTCHTAVIVRLRAYDLLAIATIQHCYYPMEMNDRFTYWGLYKISWHCSRRRSLVSWRFRHFL